MTQKKTETVQTWTRYSASALELGVSVVIGLGIGYWLDNLLGTAPWMALFWLTCGTAAGIRSLYRLAKRLEREAEEEQKDEQKDDNGRSD
jgi:ATP synthase protein I